MEHGRWNMERILAGWRWAARKDIPKKHSPYLIPWNQLPAAIRQADLEAIRISRKHSAQIIPNKKLPHSRWPSVFSTAKSIRPRRVGGAPGGLAQRFKAPVLLA
jgi:hypothetical protein